MTGPYLSRLFHQAFEAGLHHPQQRPSAAEWEEGLMKTYDLLIHCENPKCSEHYFVLNRKKTCPFCGKTLNYKIPIFELYYQNRGKWEPLKKKLYGSKDKQLHKWHFFANCALNEMLPKEDRKTIAFLRLYKGEWIFYNLGMKDLEVIENDTPKPLPINGKILVKKGMVFRNNENNGLSLKVSDFL